jgi:two-component system cell cycle response regulator DivK
VRLVLLVEDHPDTRLMYSEFLGADFQVMQAADGETALATMRAHTPDLVITDFSLPVLDGFELTARMRKDEALAKIPVICLSGYGGPAHEQRARAAGCDRLLQKPCLPETLVAAVEDLLRGRTSGGEDS